MLASLKQPILRHSRTFLGSPLLQPLGDTVAINDVLAQLNPTWSVSEIRARIVSRIPETAETTTLVLRANRLWPGFVAGQHVPVTVEIGGVRHQRTYSLSSRPDGGRDFSITVKRGGKVSSWLNDEACVGDVLTLGAPRGEFVLPDPLPARLLMISAGSGITPVMSMLRELAKGRKPECGEAAGMPQREPPVREQQPEVVFVHSSRGAADAIFERELREIARGYPGLELIDVRSAIDGRLTAEGLARRVPDFATLPTYLCGPAEFMSMIEALYAAHGATQQLTLERFGAAPLRIDADGVKAQVNCSRSGKDFAADTVNGLLAQAEAAGLNPKSGCRIGICQSCKCRKNSGTVQNLRTGEISSEPGEMIQLCISAARSDLDLDL